MDGGASQGQDSAAVRCEQLCCVCEGGVHILFCMYGIDQYFRFLGFRGLCVCNLDYYLMQITHTHTHTHTQPPGGEEVWFMKGALDVILRHCSTLPDGSPLTLADKDSFVAKSEELGTKGLRGELG